MRTPLLFIVMAAAAFVAAQCNLTPVQEAVAPAGQDGSGPGVTVTEPWARISPMSAGNGAVYLTLDNQSNSPDALLSAESDVAEAVELHESKMDENDVMQMSPVSRIEIPAGGAATLEPGGKHIMLINLTQELTSGQTINLTLNFERSAPLTVEAEVRPADAMGGMGHNN